MRAVALVSLWLSLLLVSPAGAQFGSDPTEEKDYLDAQSAFIESKYIQARKIAEKRLAANANDLIGFYIMAKVLGEEGSSPQAYLYSGKGLDYLNARWFKTSGHHQMREELMEVRYNAAMEMGKYEEALALIDQHDRSYGMSWEARAGWPLIKLGRAEECKRRMQKLIDTGEAFDKIVALNSLGALYWQLGETQASRDAFAEIVQLNAETGFPPDATILANKAESEVGLGNYKAAELDYREASGNFDQWSGANPYQALVMLYVDQGRFSEAADCAAKMYAWVNTSVPGVRIQSWATVRKQFSSFLLAAGYCEEALPLLEGLLHRPERNSNTSDKPYRLECEILFLYQDCLEITLAKTEETRSWSSWSTGFYLWGASLSQWDEYDNARQRMVGLIVGNGALSQCLIPYQTDWVAPPWLLPDLVEAAGPGVIAVEAERLLAVAKTDYPKPFLKGYLGEARLRQGDREEAIPHLQQAIDELPTEQALLRARLRLDLAVCQEQSGQTKEAMELYQKVLETDPNAFRRMGRDLPVKLPRGGGPVQDEVCDLLEGSPRFREQDYGLPVSLEVSDASVKATLSGNNGSTLVWTEAVTDETEPDIVVATCKKLHEVVFAPRIKLSRTEITGMQNAGSEALGL